MMVNIFSLGRRALPVTAPRDKDSETKLIIGSYHEIS